MNGKIRIVTDEGMAGESESVKRKVGRQAARAILPFAMVCSLNLSREDA